MTITDKTKVVECKTCGDNFIVNTPWSDGYPHAFPCPECRPDVPCDCGTRDCPGPAAVVVWKKKRAAAVT